MRMLALSAAVMLLAGAAHSLTNYATEELARMSREITSKHFKKSKCLALVTDHKNDMMDRLHPLDIPVLQVHLPFETMKDFRIPTSGLHCARVNPIVLHCPFRAQMSLCMRPPLALNNSAFVLQNVFVCSVWLSQ